MTDIDTGKWRKRHPRRAASIYPFSLAVAAAARAATGMEAMGLQRATAAAETGGTR